jgi:hypothetical protein
MIKLRSIYVIILNNETEFITEILEENRDLDIPKFRTSIGQRLKDRSNTEGLRYGMVKIQKTLFIANAS